MVAWTMEDVVLLTSCQALSCHRSGKGLLSILMISVPEDLLLDVLILVDNASSLFRTVIEHGGVICELEMKWREQIFHVFGTISLSQALSHLSIKRIRLLQVVAYKSVWRFQITVSEVCSNFFSTALISQNRMAHLRHFVQYQRILHVLIPFHFQCV